jgi:hypothetical protein
MNNTKAINWNIEKIVKYVNLIKDIYKIKLEPTNNIVERFLEQTNIKIEYMSLAEIREKGFFTVNSSGDVILNIWEMEMNPRIRTKISEALGYYYLFYHTTPNFATFDSPHYFDARKRVMIFACEFLMPSTEIKKLYADKPSTGQYQNILELANIFNVNVDVFNWWHKSLKEIKPTISIIEKATGKSIDEVLNDEKSTNS